MSSNPKMHEGEFEIDDGLVRRLIGTQFPEWAGLPIERVGSIGTDNVLYRLGSEMVVRLPRIEWAVEDVHHEQTWLPKLAPSLPLEVPTPLAMGVPEKGYPCRWSIYRWIEGENHSIDSVPNARKAAIDLAHFLTKLQEVDVTGAPLAAAGSRGASLLTREPYVHEAIASLSDSVDAPALLQVWNRALQASEWTRSPVWYHGDLSPGNVLFHQGRLTAVIDFGNLCVGDPACDTMIAWSLFTGDSRRAFREELGLDEAAWVRGRGHAVAQAVIFIPYYLHTNPAGVKNARRLLSEVLADHDETL